jgi:putative ABC transport system permease protein
MPIYEGGMGLRVTGTLAIRRIIAFAFPPDALPLDIGNPDQVRDALKVPGAVLFDRRSRPIYGEIHVGRDIELDGQLHRVAGFVSIGPDIVNDGALVMSEGSWLTAQGADARPIMAAIRLEHGADLQQVRKQILQSLPADVSVMTPAEVRWREALFTMRAAPIGLLFGTGVLAGLVIGALTCYQVLFQLIMDRIKEFATLRAMGFSDPFLRRVVMHQALALACPAFAMGLALSIGGYAYLQMRTALTIPLTITTACMVFALTLAMSAFAGRVAVRNLAAADPAALF